GAAVVRGEGQVEGAGVNGRRPDPRDEEGGARPERGAVELGVQVGEAVRPVVGGGSRHRRADAATPRERGGGGEGAEAEPPSERHSSPTPAVHEVRVYAGRGVRPVP